jgi:hypothetical protein
MSPPVNKQILNWQDTLREFLIEGGTEGWGQREIVKRLESQVLVEDIIPELEFLLNCTPPKVQKFQVPTKGRTKTVWRATIHILKG